MALKISKIWLKAIGCAIIGIIGMAAAAGLAAAA
jgi:hypothetical protein